MKHHYLYIMSNVAQTLYIGVTNDLERRVYEHKHRLVPGFTSKYGLTQLVYFAEFTDVREAIRREKQLKGWKRERKIGLIVGLNPEWRDLAADWFGATDSSSR